MSRMRPLGLVSIAFSLACGSAFASVDKDLSTEDILKMRDPFKRIALPPKNAVILSELEAFATDQFKFLAVIKGMDRPRAILSGPSGKTYFVSDGARIGTHRGVIRKITEDRILVRERFVNLLGKDEAVDIELKLNVTENKPASKSGVGW